MVLDDRFQQAIDRAAIVAGKTTAQDYVAEWRRTSTPCGDDLEAVAEAEAARLEQSYPPERLDRLVDHGGLDDEPRPPERPAREPTLRRRTVPAGLPSRRHLRPEPRCGQWRSEGEGERRPS